MVEIYRTEEAGRRALERYRRELAHWPVPADHLKVATREGETFVLASGPPGAPALVLLHGAGANAAAWREDVAAWSEHFRVYAVDLIGEPGLSAPARPDPTTEATALWLDDVLDGLGLERILLVGTSLGGWTALDHAIRRPGRVEALGLLCPAGIGRERRWSLAGAALSTLFGERGRRRAVRTMTGLDRPEDRAMLEAVFENFSDFRPRTARLPLFSDADLRSLAMPVQVIVGERDRMFDSARTLRRVHAHVPHARTLSLPGVGHAVLGRTGPVLEFLLDRAGGGHPSHPPQDNGDS
ncbi:alpha/beta fold hydrolase [Nocardiopsis alba]|uniref:alpha/beta fold hydrolase n=1 Tax=Nocardiopsis alba TaxID=53437 RepID=UPI0033B63545